MALMALVCVFIWSTMTAVSLLPMSRQKSRLGLPIEHLVGAAVGLRQGLQPKTLPHIDQGRWRLCGHLPLHPR